MSDLDTLTLRPIPGPEGLCPYIKNDTTQNFSTVSLPRSTRGLIEVTRNGRVLRHHIQDDCTVVIWPVLPLEGDYLRFRWHVETNLREPIKAPRSCRSPSEISYGLQHRSDSLMWTGQRII